MTEEEYILATNRVKISAAKDFEYDCLCGDGYGITADERTKLHSLLLKIEDRMFAMLDGIGE